MYIVPLVKTVPAGNMPYMTRQHHSAQKFSAKLLIIPDTGNFINYDQLDNDLEEAIDLFRKGVDGNMESTENCIPV